MGLGYSLTASTSMPPPRPSPLNYGGVRELYLAFREVFCFGAGTYSEIASTCGHKLCVFDHNFFHLVKLDDPLKPKPLQMADEEKIILRTRDGFGPYIHDPYRARYLRSALLTLLEPDEVWRDPSLQTADWAYIKAFDDAIQYTMFYVARRRKPRRLVPATSFYGDEGDANRKRKGTKIYP